MTDQPPPPYDVEPYGEPTPPPPPHPVRRLLAPIIAVAIGLLKFGAVIVKLKFFTLAFSALASIWAYALLYGWKFAVGFVLLIGIHEIGHVVMLRARGIEAGLPVFLPFLGAFVSMKESPKTAYDEAVSGIAGPVFGAIASFGALGAGIALDNELLRVLAYVGFFMNLFNLAPVLPLDGGRTAGALSPKLWFVGLGALLAYTVWRPHLVVLVILALGGYELYGRWKNRDTVASKVYHALSTEQRVQVGTAYAGLIVVLIWAMQAFPLPPR